MCESISFAQRRVTTLLASFFQKAQPHIMKEITIATINSSWSKLASSILVTKKVFCWAFQESLARKSKHNDTSQSSIHVHSLDQPNLWKLRWLHQFVNRSLECFILSPQSLLHSKQPHSPTEANLVCKWPNPTL
jgi:hypothetical protein